MKAKRLFLIFIFTSLLAIYSCNATGYEYEEEEGEAPKTETKPEIKQEVEQPKTEIKQEVNKDNKSLSSYYVIQIGAFSNESNAVDFLRKVKKFINYDISYKLIDGLYKVRTSDFSSKSEAFSAIEKIVSNGIKDPFIIELKK